MTNKMRWEKLMLQSGVDVEAGYEVVERIKQKARGSNGACGCHRRELLVALVACLTFQNRC